MSNRHADLAATQEVRTFCLWCGRAIRWTYEFCRRSPKGFNFWDCGCRRQAPPPSTVAEERPC